MGEGGRGRRRIGRLARDEADGRDSPHPRKSAGRGTQSPGVEVALGWGGPQQFGGQRPPGLHGGRQAGMKCALVYVFMSVLALFPST